MKKIAAMAVVLAVAGCARERPYIRDEAPPDISKMDGWPDPGRTAPADPEVVRAFSAVERLADEMATHKAPEVKEEDRDGRPAVRRLRAPKPPAKPAVVKEVVAPPAAPPPVMAPLCPGGEAVKVEFVRFLRRIKEVWGSKDPKLDKSKELAAAFRAVQARLRLRYEQCKADQAAGEKVRRLETSVEQLRTTIQKTVKFDT